VQPRGRAPPERIRFIREEKIAAPLPRMCERIELQPVEVREVNDFKDAFVTMGRQGVHAVFGAPGVLTFANRQMIVDLAAKDRIPAMWAIGSLWTSVGSCLMR
jgi:hypothetical protein